MKLEEAIFGFALLVIFKIGFCCKRPRFFGFGVHCGVRSFRFLVFVKNTSGFSVLVPDVVFGFFYFVIFWVLGSVRFEQHLKSDEGLF